MALAPDAPKVIALPVRETCATGRASVPIFPVIATVDAGALIVKFLGVASDVTAPVIVTLPPVAV